MKISKTIRISVAVASLALYPAVGTALPLDNGIGGAFRLAVGDGRVADVAYDMRSAFDSTPDGLAAAGSNSMFLAITLGDQRTFATDEWTGLRTNAEYVAEGFAEAVAVATQEAVRARGSALSLASGVNEVAASVADNWASLVSSASAQAGGASESSASSADEWLNVDSTTTALGTGRSDSIVVSGDGTTTFTTVSSTALTDSDASLFSADNMASMGVSEGTALAHSVVDALAFTTDESTILVEDTTDGGYSSTDTLTVTTNERLAANSSASALATSLREILVASVDTLISANSGATSLGVGFSDTFSVLTDEHRLIAGGVAGFLSTSSGESFAGVTNASDIFASASGVEAIAFGYTEAWIETIPSRFRADPNELPAPACLSLVALGMFCIALVSLRIRSQTFLRQVAHRSRIDPKRFTE